LEFFKYDEFDNCDIFRITIIHFLNKTREITFLRYTNARQLIIDDALEFIADFHQVFAIIEFRRDMHALYDIVNDFLVYIFDDRLRYHLGRVCCWYVVLGLAIFPVSSLQKFNDHYPILGDPDKSLMTSLGFIHLDGDSSFVSLRHGPC
jgi:hypothetical protein